MATKKIKIKVLNPLARKYQLSASVDSEVSLPKPLAFQIVENKDGEFVNADDKKAFESENAKESKETKK